MAFKPPFNFLRSRPAEAAATPPGGAEAHKPGSADSAEMSIEELYGGSHKDASDFTILNRHLIASKIVRNPDAAEMHVHPNSHPAKSPPSVEMLSTAMSSKASGTLNRLLLRSPQVSRKGSGESSSTAVAPSPGHSGVLDQVLRAHGGSSAALRSPPTGSASTPTADMVVSPRGHHAGDLPAANAPTSQQLPQQQRPRQPRRKEAQQEDSDDSSSGDSVGLPEVGDMPDDHTPSRSVPLEEILKARQHTLKPGLGGTGNRPRAGPPSNPGVSPSTPAVPGSQPAHGGHSVSSSRNGTWDGTRDVSSASRRVAVPTAVSHAGRGPSSAGGSKTSVSDGGAQHDHASMAHNSWAPAAAAAQVRGLSDGAGTSLPAAHPSQRSRQVMEAPPPAHTPAQAPSSPPPSSQHHLGAPHGGSHAPSHAPQIATHAHHHPPPSDLAPPPPSPPAAAPTAGPSAAPGPKARGADPAPRSSPRVHWEDPSVTAPAVMIDSHRAADLLAGHAATGLDGGFDGPPDLGPNLSRSGGYRFTGGLDPHAHAHADGQDREGGYNPFTPEEERKWMESIMGRQLRAKMRLEGHVPNTTGWGLQEQQSNRYGSWGANGPQTMRRGAMPSSRQPAAWQAWQRAASSHHPPLPASASMNMAAAYGHIQDPSVTAPATVGGPAVPRPPMLGAAPSARTRGAPPPPLVLHPQPKWAAVPTGKLQHRPPSRMRIPASAVPPTPPGTAQQHGAWGIQKTQPATGPDAGGHDPLSFQPAYRPKPLSLNRRSSSVTTLPPVPASPDILSPSGDHPPSFILPPPDSDATQAPGQPAHDPAVEAAAWLPKRMLPAIPEPADGHSGDMPPSPFTRPVGLQLQGLSSTDTTPDTTTTTGHGDAMEHSLAGQEPAAAVPAPPMQPPSSARGREGPGPGPSRLSAATTAIDAPHVSEGQGAGAAGAGGDRWGTPEGSSPQAAKIAARLLLQGAAAAALQGGARLRITTSGPGSKGSSGASSPRRAHSPSPLRSPRVSLHTTGDGEHAGGVQKVRGPSTLQLTLSGQSGVGLPHAGTLARRSIRRLGTLQGAGAGGGSVYSSRRSGVVSRRGSVRMGVRACQGLMLQVMDDMQQGKWSMSGRWEAVSDHGSPHISETLQRISHDCMTYIKELGRGQFGSVWLAQWRGVEVALKELHDAVLTDHEQQQVFHEAERLAALRHPCVVALYGVVAEAPDRYGTVLEFVGGGSLSKALAKLETQVGDLPLHVKAGIALQAARGMEYLHSQNVIHLDLKCDNLLCDLRDLNRPVVKIADLGLSQVTGGNMELRGQKMQGTIAWMAPELFPGGNLPSRAGTMARRRTPARARALGGPDDSMWDLDGAEDPAQTLPWEDDGLGDTTMTTSTLSHYGGTGDPMDEDDDVVTYKVDVYAFAICLLEIWNMGRPPFLEIPAEERKVRIMAGGGRLRPALPANCPPEWVQLIKDCWVGAPSQRPDFTQVADRLTVLAQPPADHA